MKPIMRCMNCSSRSSRVTVVMAGPSSLIFAGPLDLISGDQV